MSACQHETKDNETLLDAPIPPSDGWAIGGCARELARNPADRRRRPAPGRYVNGTA